MWLRSLLSVLLPVLGVSAQDRTDALEAVAPLATALTDGDSIAFANALPADGPNIEELKENVKGLIAQAQVTSSIEVIRETNGTAELDWYMEIRSRATGMILEARRGVVHIGHQGKKLRSIGPAAHFAPAKVAR